jgi:hypothetical protein
MTDLPSIYNPDPVVVPAQDQKTYPDSYLVGMFLSPPDENLKQSMTLVYRPYNKVAGEMYPSTDKDIRFIIADILAEAARAPLFAQAMGYVLTSASLGLQEKTLMKQIAELPDNDPGLAALQTQLAAVHNAMGIV